METLLHRHRLAALLLSALYRSSSRTGPPRQVGHDYNGSTHTRSKLGLRNGWPRCGEFWFQASSKYKSRRSHHSGKAAARRRASHRGVGSPSSFTAAQRLASRRVPTIPTIPTPHLSLYPNEFKDPQKMKRASRPAALTTSELPTSPTKCLPFLIPKRTDSSFSVLTW